MSVRRRQHRNGKTGAVKETWMVDISYRGPSGKAFRIRQKSPVQTKRGAEQFERQLRQEMLERSEEDRKEKKEAPKFEEFAEEFMTTYATVNNKHSELESKRSIFNRHLIPAFSGVRLDEIGKREMERYKSKKQVQGLTNKTINNHLTVLHKMLDVAVDWEILNSAPKVQWLKVKPPEWRFLDFDETARLIENAESQWSSMIIVAVNTGLRLGELLGLRWSDVDFDNRLLNIRRAWVRGKETSPKSGKERTVPLNADAHTALRSQRSLNKFVFCQRSGERLTKNMCRRPLNRACRKAGIPEMGWHVLRHTFASHLAIRGAGLKDIQEILGHQSIQQTMRYAHLSRESKRRALELIETNGTIAAQKKDDAAK